MNSAPQKNGERLAAPLPRIVSVDLLSASAPRSSGREFQIGLFALAAVAAVLVILFMLTDPSTLQGRTVVYTTVADAGGLRRGDPVQMRGVNIGRVDEFEMTQQGVLIHLALDRRYSVPSDSRIVLRSSGLLGGMTAEVVPGNSTSTVTRGTVMAGAVEKDMFGAAADLGDRADAVMAQVQALLSDRTVEALGGSIVELNRLLVEMNGLVSEQRAEMKTLNGSLQRSAAGVERTMTGPELQRVLASMDSVAMDLRVVAASVGQASVSLDSTLGRLERGEGTLGRFSRDEALYENLTATAENLNRLVEDVRQNPRRYVNLRVF